MLVGVISDTHGLLRPEAITALAGVDHILHAGDIGDISIIERLQEIAPITAIRGNIDTSGACAGLPATEAVELDGAWFYLIHSVRDLDLSPATAGFAAVISGHTHQPGSAKQSGILYLNPGSAGPLRFKLPVTLAKVTVEHRQLTASIVPLL